MVHRHPQDGVHLALSPGNDDDNDDDNYNYDHNDDNNNDDNDDDAGLPRPPDLSRLEEPRQNHQWSARQRTDSSRLLL